MTNATYNEKNEIIGFTTDSKAKVISEDKNGVVCEFCNPMTGETLHVTF
ncbi:TPA: hypothetical protein ACGUPI_004757 [Vibrio vulnificus]